MTTSIAGTSLLDLAEQLFGEVPVLWGRYFTSTAAPGNVEYGHLKENQPLRDRGIRVLPIARQTLHVSGSQANGSADAEANTDDLVATFGADYLASQGGQFLLFLDVEGAPALSEDYYFSWATTLMAHSRSSMDGKVTILPGVYGVQSDDTTWPPPRWHFCESPLLELDASLLSHASFRCGVAIPAPPSFSESATWRC